MQMCIMYIYRKTYAYMYICIYIHIHIGIYVYIYYIYIYIHVYVYLAFRPTSTEYGITCFISLLFSCPPHPNTNDSF